MQPSRTRSTICSRYSTRYGPSGRVHLLCGCSGAGVPRAAQKPEGGSIKHDISVPVAAVPALIEEANAAVVKLIPGSRPVPFGHLGDGNIHYNVSQPVGGNTADFMARWHEVNKVVFDIVLRMGGSISAEHGIGVLKRDELPDVKDKTAIELMRSFKAMLDPKGIMNPGKVL